MGSATGERGEGPAARLELSGSPGQLNMNQSSFNANPNVFWT